MDQELRGLLRRSPLRREQDDLLHSVPGVGRQVSPTLLAHLPELGMLDGKQIATLVGVGAINRDSGALRGKRTVWGGRSRVRALFYMGALVASSYNPVIRVLYQRLVPGGQPKKVALTAGMRKLLTIANTRVRTGQHWNSNMVSP